MTVLGGLLFLLGIIVFLASIVWLVVWLFRRRPVRTPLLSMLAGVILFVVGLVFVAIGAPDTTSVPNAQEIPIVPTPTSIAPTPIPDGKKRTEPALYGHPIVHSSIEITVLDVTRGWYTYESPDAGNEWVVIELRLRNVGDANKTKRYSPLHFRLTGQLGVIYEEGAFNLFTPEADHPLGSGEFFGGAEITGEIVLQVKMEDRNLVLIYSPPFSGSRYMSLEKP